MASKLSAPAIASVEDVTTEWLSQILETEISSFLISQIGTGQVSQCYRLTLTHSPQSKGNLECVILKVASTDPNSRHAGLSLGIYEKEIRFYQDIAPSLEHLGSLAKCYHSSWDPVQGTFALLLEDANGAPGNDIQGATIAQAECAVTELGRIHGEILRNPSLIEKKWMQRSNRVTQAVVEVLFAGFVERYKERLKPEHLEVCMQLVSSFDLWQQEQSNDRHVKGLVHGDYRLDNLLLGGEAAGVKLTVVDWQTVTVGPVMTDFAYFVGSSLRVDDRRKHLEELLGLYIHGLGESSGITAELALQGVKQQAFFGVLMAICSPMMVQRTERGDDMFMTMMERHCSAVLDLKSLDTLPKSEHKTPLQPKVEDEHPHEPGTEEFWNESWYFDLVDEKSGVGAYVRLGRYPNLKGSWYTAVVTHPEKGLFAVTDYECPHPKEDMAVETPIFCASQEIISPLQDYRVTLKGQAEQYTNPSDVLKGKQGSKSQLEFDVNWRTEGVPYQWRMTTRYEIPCRATGKIVVDGQEIIFEDVVAQRDHSHGVRDWWSADWMWCAFHLHDGTRIHGADLRIPKLGRISVGYIQSPETPVAELIKCISDEKMADNQLPESAVVTLDYQGGEEGIVVNVKPMGHGPLRLVAPDGRVSNFTRCWAELKCNDGRTGVGWIEWNHTLNTVEK